MREKSAIVRDITNGIMADMSSYEYPTVVYGFDLNEDNIIIEKQGTLYGHIISGTAEIKVGDRNYEIPAGDYFSLNTQDKLTISGKIKGFGVLRLGYSGLNTIGGPVTEPGRLKYIDGCSDTLLISPPRKGDACFNMLSFPADIDQTAHTHPTMRAGLIYKGAGICRMKEGSEELVPGKVFILYPDAIHAFSTVGTQGMALTVFHPDSDFGPDDEEHPMLNRTIVNGISAKNINSIRTKEIL